MPLSVCLCVYVSKMHRSEKKFISRGVPSVMLSDKCWQPSISFDVFTLKSNWSDETDLVTQGTTFRLKPIAKAAQEITSASKQEMVIVLRQIARMGFIHPAVPSLLVKLQKWFEWSAVLTALQYENIFKLLSINNLHCFLDTCVSFP